MQAQGRRILLLALAAAALLAAPWSGGAEGARRLAQAFPAYALFSILLAGAGFLAWRGRQWIAAAGAAALLAAGFLYFFFLPGAALPPLLVLAASLVRPPARQ